jgi:hypothetical protein
VKIDKEEFNRRVGVINSLATAAHRRLTIERNSIEYNEDITALAEHDPKFAQLCMEADFAALEPLNKLIRYLAAKLEN